jgi:K(+)-stimulated pyrophosphate-energized sodium pump
MMTMLATFGALIVSLFTAGTASAAALDELNFPDFSQVTVLGMNGDTFLMLCMGICFVGMVIGMVLFLSVRKMPAHKSMLEVSELIYETCKTYLITQVRFILLLAVFVGVIIVAYYAWLAANPMSIGQVLIVLLWTLIGIAGSCGVAWFGIRVNTYANSRAAFVSLRGKPYPTYMVPLRSGMSIGTMLISTELVLMFIIILFIPATYAAACFIGFAIGASLGASVLRIAGGIFTKIADIGADLMKIVFNIKEDDARNPGVIADCAGDNAGDSVGPTADAFETYGVTAVALISFILLAVTAAADQSLMLIWIFAIAVMMIVSSLASYAINQAIAGAKYANADKMNFETPLTSLVWITSITSIVLTFVLSYLLVPNLGDGTMWYKLAAVISCGTLAGALIPEVVKSFTSTNSRHVKEVVIAAREGSAPLNILAGLTAGNFSAFWLGFVIMALMGVAFGISTTFPTGMMVAPAIFAFGLVAFGFLAMGPVTIAVDSYGPVTDNAQSVYELSLIETLPGITEEISKDFGFTPNWDKAKHYLEENDGAGNTFKATAKPVLIGTAVVGATTLIFAIIMMLTESLTVNLEMLSILHAPFLLGFLAGGSVIYWFSGASLQAVSTGAYRAVEFIKRTIKLDEGATKASTEDSKKVVEICTQYAQKGMLNIFMGLLFITLACAFLEPYFFISYLLALAFFGLFQAIFMANAGGAWDNAKKIVEVDLKEKGTDLHSACVVGDTVGDPFKDTSSVAMNPIIKFASLFGLIAVQLAIQLGTESLTLNYFLSGTFFLVGFFFVYRSFYNMRIESEGETEHTKAQALR